jgi:hypothetical protein
MAMVLTLEELKEAIRDGTLTFCMPAAHAEFSSEFLEDFSQRVLKYDWRHVMECSDFRAPSLLNVTGEKDELVAAIDLNYGADVSDLPGLPLWEVLRRCAVTNKA